MPKRIIKVFLASPGDLTGERVAFKKEIEFLNLGFGDGANCEFVSLGWEDTLAATGRRPQAVIDREVDQCDVFILTMWRRWGQEAPDVKPCNSYTEHEFHLALDRFNKTKSPEIFVFFKHIDPGQMADPGEQLKKVLTFRRELENSRIVLYRNFADEAEFTKEVSRHLRAFAKGELPAADEPLQSVPLPVELVRRVEQAEAKAQEHSQRAEAEKNRAEAAIARAEAMTLALARRASKAAFEGRIEEARQDFAKATEATTNLEVLCLGCDFYQRVGELSTAQTLLHRWLDISGRKAMTTATAAAYGNLGVIYDKLGNLAEAEKMHLEALSIDEAGGELGPVAADYGNLALVHVSRGNLDQAEELLRKALTIHEKLGQRAAMAADYVNLSDIQGIRGEFARAGQLLKVSLSICEEIGDPEALAMTYGALGNIYGKQGDTHEAQKHLLKALAIFETIGHLEGIATQCGNLGNVYQAHGELEKAEHLHKKALAIQEKIGRSEGVACAYSNLGAIQHARDDLVAAEENYNKALTVFEKHGYGEGMSIQYRNLGYIYQARRDNARARDYWTQARDLYTKAQMPHKAAQIQQLLDGLEA